MKKNIDILLSVVDNLGDMGYALELMLGLGREYHYTLWTDALEVTEAFFLRNAHLLPPYECYHIADRTFSPQPCIISVLHAPLPDILPRNGLILHVSYLSLDPHWVSYNGSEHIRSTVSCPIREIIPSPLSGGAGIFAPKIGSIHRRELAGRFSLDPSLPWVTVFVYPDTLHHVLDLTSGQDNHEYLILGAQSLMLPVLPKNIHIIPDTDIETFYHFLSYAEWSIIRGEVSAMYMFYLGKPFFWDMYKMIGGFDPDQSENFLSCIGADETYRHIHGRLNHVNFGRLSLVECSQGFPENMFFSQSNRPLQRDIVHEVKKYIDSFYFSL